MRASRARHVDAPGIGKLRGFGVRKRRQGNPQFGAPKIFAFESRRIPQRAIITAASHAVFDEKQVGLGVSRAHQQLVISEARSRRIKEDFQRIGGIKRPVAWPYALFDGRHFRLGATHAQINRVRIAGHPHLSCWSSTPEFGPDRSACLSNCPATQTQARVARLSTRRRPICHPKPKAPSGAARQKYRRARRALCQRG